MTELKRVQSSEFRVQGCRDGRCHSGLELRVSSNLLQSMPGCFEKALQGFYKSFAGAL